MAASRCGALGPIVEIGSYCGRSTLYLADGARAAGARMLAVDHHRGSEEHQPGWDWHDPAHWDEEAGAVDTLPAFRRTLRAGGVEDVVTPIVAASRDAAALIPSAGMVFIDGSHTLKSALTDWRCWGPKVAAGGLLAIHDVFPDPRDGGRPPTVIAGLATASGLFALERQVATLVFFTRIV